ncbi:Regulatory protein PchR [compost metagenome]
MSFIKLYGINPTEYLLEIRMRKALALLDSGLQVAQVAWQVGYKYPNNFTVAFTRFYGKSPKAMFSHKV